MSALYFLVGLLALGTSVEGFGTLCGSDGLRLGRNAAFPAPTTMPKNLRIAFIGDAGSGSQQKDVLKLIKDWKAVGVIHSGDFEYKDSASTFEKQIDDVLGPNYPYFGSIGNHDTGAWGGSSGHQARLTARLERIGAKNNCVGEYGINMACNWNGLYFVLSGAGTRGSKHDQYIDDAFSAYPWNWKFSSWHKNQKLMQIGGKSDETGYAVYDTTRKHGAIVATGHEHSYCRSYMMKDFSKQQVANFNETLNMRPGESFVFVSGLAGKSIRSWKSDLANNEWWAAVGASNNGVSDGALLCEFYIDNNPDKAHCMFLDRKGKVWDDFDIYTHMGGVDTSKSADTCTPSFLDIPVTNSDGDVTVSLEDGSIKCDAETIRLGAKAEAAVFRFDSVPMRKGAKVMASNLQVMGAGANPRDIPSLTIRAAINADVTCGATNSLAGVRTLSHTVSWNEADEEEDWEAGEVWLSADISGLIEEVAASSEWEYGSSITLILEGASSLEVKTFDDSACLAPSLSIEIDDC